MTMQSGQGTGSVGSSFAEHVRAFHRSLPPEEQELLEQVFALAGNAYQSTDDTEGHSLQLPVAGRKAGEGQKEFASVALQEVLLANLFGPR